MKKTFRLLGVALVATAMLFAGCNKNEEEDDDEEEISLDISAPTEVQNRNALIEEFTGVNCGYCPDGHRMVNELMAANPGRVYAINIHTGQYAIKYTTSFGSALANQSNIKGYPAGSVNRHVFSSYSQRSGGTAMSRDKFTAAATEIMSQPACANIAAKAMINKSTRELTVGVAVYYTSAPTNTTNLINVAVIEDSIWGQQSGGQTHNPTQYDATTQKYCHTHMLRHLVTEQWGDAITPVVGQQIKKEYKYTLPATISNEPVVPEHLDIIVFLTEDHQEVINVCEAPITLN